MKRKKLAVLLCASLILAATAAGLAVGLKNAADTREIQRLTERLEEADGHIPSDFTKEDMDRFLENADPEVIAGILKKIDENAQAVSLPIVDDNEYTRPPENTPITIIQYDYETGEETINVSEPPVK